MDTSRPTVACSNCGRLLYWDHGLKEKNLTNHEGACATREKKVKMRTYRRNQTKAANRARSIGAGSTVVPGKGQLGLGIDESVPKEIE